MKTLSLKLPPRLSARLERAARQRGQTKSALVRAAGLSPTYYLLPIARAFGKKPILVTRIAVKLGDHPSQHSRRAHRAADERFS